MKIKFYVYQNNKLIKKCNSINEADELFDELMNSGDKLRCDSVKIGTLWNSRIEKGTIQNY